MGVSGRFDRADPGASGSAISGDTTSKAPSGVPATGGSPPGSSS